MKIVVVTASVGERRRRLLTPAIDCRDAGVEYLAFVDYAVKHDVWRTIQVENAEGVDRNRIAKRYKTEIAEHGADASIWIDRHCRLMCDPTALFEEFPEDVVVVKHYRSNVFAEAAACRRQSKDDPELISRTVERWRLEGITPEDLGLYYGGFIARRHPAADRFSALWANYIASGSRRDQLSLPIALERSGVSFRGVERGRMREFFHIRGK